MKKEVLLSILFGLLVGLVITYGMYRVRTAITNTPSNEMAEVATTSASLEAAPTLVTILSPEDGAVLSEETITVTGSTIPNAHIVLFVNNSDYISTSDATGNFAFEVSLNQGANILTVHVLDQEGRATVAERVVAVTDVYSSEPSSATSSAQKSGSESEETE